MERSEGFALSALAFDNTVYYRILKTLDPSPVALGGEEGLPEVRLGEGDAEELASGRQNPARQGTGVAGGSRCKRIRLEDLFEGDELSTKSLTIPVGLIEHLEDAFPDSRRRVPRVLLIHEEDVQGACAQHEGLAEIGI